ncbi:MAG: UvrD-helicase domain-containing protein [Gammaproteobacteria bacterium]|nr:UvrD-helicase domain-containing protein [Gammaproteobacteria bacterium]
MNFFNTWINWRHSLFFLWQRRELKRHKKFFDTVEKNSLTIQQRQAIIADEKRTLVIAGAGTGKTSVIIAKIGYLIKSGKCKPEDLLVITYNNAAAAELRLRAEQRLKDIVIFKSIQEDIGTIKTFHAIGNNILKAGGSQNHVSEFADQKSKNKQFINQVLDKLLLDNEMKRIYTEYFEQYEFPNDIDGKSFETLEEHARWIQSIGRLQTLNSDYVKSYGELKIANFLFRNGISYTYEKHYQPLDKVDYDGHYRPDFFLDESGVYIEYFGIDKNEKTAKHIDRDKYIEDMNKKKILHRQGKTKLISLYYHQIQDNILLKELRKNLINLNINLKPQPDEAILRLINQSNKHTRFIELFERFLGPYKERIPSLSIDKFISKSEIYSHNYHLLNIFKKLFYAYQEELYRKNEIDFSDMISSSKQMIDKERLSIKWKYIIIDEFQDISMGRCDFIKAILKKNHKAKLFCVGDDWQAIYRFTGCDNRIMTDFKKYFGSVTSLELNQTFRFNDQIAKVSEQFILKNKRQLKKHLKTKISRRSAQVFIHWHPQNQTSAFYQSIKEIQLNFKNTKDFSLLILFRYQASKNTIVPKNTLSELKQDWGSVECLTVHAAKGLEADFVIVADITSGFHSFPNERVDDSILDFVLSEKDEFIHSEERRLLYVALTRAKEQVHLLADSISPSVFAQELSQNKSVKSIADLSVKHHCPACDRNNTKGILIKQAARNGMVSYRCSNKPLCNIHLYPCKECRTDLVIREKNSDQSPTSRAFCLNKECLAEYEACGCCDYGYFVTKPGKLKPFLACCLYRSTGCRNKPHKINPARSGRMGQQSS